MFVRPAQVRDLHRLTEITITSLKDDPAFDYMWSYWRDFSEDNFVWWQMTLQGWFHDLKTEIWVTVLEDSDDGDNKEASLGQPRRQDTIISYCVWERWTRSNYDKPWHKKSINTVRGFRRRLQRIVDIICTKLQLRSLNRSGPRRDANFSHLQAFYSAQDLVTQQCWNDVLELWNLELLVTDHRYRRRGAATQLVEKLTRRANTEGAYCRVEASPMGKLLYEACQFKELAVFNVKAPGDEEEIPLWCMRRSPPSPGAYR